LAFFCFCLLRPKSKMDNGYLFAKNFIPKPKNFLGKMRK
jgi:hypothetical protein